MTVKPSVKIGGHGIEDNGFFLLGTDKLFEQAALLAFGSAALGGHLFHSPRETMQHKKPNRLPKVKMFFFTVGTRRCISP